MLTRYASMYMGSNVLLTCYNNNNNLADSYNFKCNCANFGENNNLFIIPIWNYVTLPECKQTILNGKNWSLFFEDTFVRPEETHLVGGKDPKTDWILRVNSIMNKLSKESYSVPVDEYSYVKSVHEWLMGTLVF